MAERPNSRGDSVIEDSHLRGQEEQQQQQQQQEQEPEQHPHHQECFLRPPSLSQTAASSGCGSSVVSSNVSSSIPTPSMSALPSSANLVGTSAGARTLRQRLRQLSATEAPPAQLPHLSRDGWLQTAKRAAAAAARVPVLLALLFVFICSLDLLSSAFRLLAGKAAGENRTSRILFFYPPKHVGFFYRRREERN